MYLYTFGKHLPIYVSYVNKTEGQYCVSDQSKHICKTTPCENPRFHTRPLHAPNAKHFIQALSPCGGAHFAAHTSQPPPPARVIKRPPKTTTNRRTQPATPKHPNPPPQHSFTKTDAASRPLARTRRSEHPPSIWVIVHMQPRRRHQSMWANEPGCTRPASRRTVLTYVRAAYSASYVLGWLLNGFSLGVMYQRSCARCIYIASTIPAGRSE